MTGDIWKSVDKSAGEYACWPWRGSLNYKGYGRAGNRNAHRVAWEVVHGPASRALHVDHLCRNRACCNPKHLQLVTCKENVRRGVAGRTPECVAALLRGRANASRRRCLYALWVAQPHHPLAIQRDMKGLRRTRLSVLRSIWVAQPHALCAHGHAMNEGLVRRGRGRSGGCAECNKNRCRSFRARVAKA